MNDKYLFFNPSYPILTSNTINYNSNVSNSFFPDAKEVDIRKIDSPKKIINLYFSREIKSKK